MCFKAADRITLSQDVAVPCHRESPMILLQRTRPSAGRVPAVAHNGSHWRGARSTLTTNLKQFRAGVDDDLQLDRN